MRQGRGLGYQGVVWKPGPNLTKITPKPRHGGSVPPRHVYSANELRWNTMTRPSWSITQFDRKGKVVRCSVISGQ